MQTNHTHKPIPFIRKLCAHKSEEEIREAEERFICYLHIVKRICLRLEQEERGIDTTETDQ